MISACSYENVPKLEFFCFSFDFEFKSYFLESFSNCSIISLPCEEKNAPNMVMLIFGKFAECMCEDSECKVTASSIYGAASRLILCKRVNSRKESV